MSVRIIGESCVVTGCMRPARELGRNCLAHWLALTPRERHMLQWEAQNTQAAGPDMLEAVWLLPAVRTP